MSVQDVVNPIFPNEPESYWQRAENPNPDVYVLDDPAGEWSAAAIATGEVTLWNYYDCIDAKGEPDTCEQEILIDHLPSFLDRLIALRDRAEGYFDNDAWRT